MSNRNNSNFKGGYIQVIIIAVLAMIALFLFVLGIGLVGELTGLNSGAATTASGPTGPVTPVSGSCPSVQTIDQQVSGWCGVASAAEIIAFYKGNYAKYSSYAYMAPWNSRIDPGKLNRESGKNYQFTDNVDSVINSVKSGRPAIAYTKIYGQHIIVLTCYDDATQTFTANNSEPRGKGGQQSVQTINGSRLTKTNLTGPLNGGHTSFYTHAEFLVTN